MYISTYSLLCFYFSRYNSVTLCMKLFSWRDFVLMKTVCHVETTAGFLLSTWLEQTKHLQSAVES